VHNLGLSETLSPSPRSSLDLRLATPNTEIKHIIYLGLFIIPICILFAFIAWKLIAEMIDKDFVEPVLEFAKGGPAFDKSKVKLAELIQVHESAKITSAIAMTTKMLAHDIRRPFSMMYGLLESLQDNTHRTDELIKKYSPKVQTALEDISSMIEEITSIGSGRAAHRSEIEPLELIQSVLSDLFRPNRGPSVVIHSHTSRKILANPTKVRRIVTNLISNAVEIGAKDIVVLFKEAENSEFLEIEIRNSGPIIPQDHIDKIFDPFFTSDKKDGTGLGLAICKDAVEAHGGKIWVRSNAVDGTSFFFTLPVAPAVPLIKVEHTSKEVPSDFGSVKILMIDDDELYGEQLSSYITDDRSLRLTTAQGFEEAKESLALKHPDIILLDIDFGPTSEDGFSIARKLRQFGYRGLIYFHSNRSISNFDNVDGILQKPISRQIFYNFLTEVGTKKLKQSH
jgi:signal transduction histidine kinase